jgi:hypothetical protein
MLEVDGWRRIGEAPTRLGPPLRPSRRILDDDEELLIRKVSPVELPHVKVLVHLSRPVRAREFSRRRWSLSIGTVITVDRNCATCGRRLCLEQVSHLAFLVVHSAKDLHHEEELPPITPGTNVDPAALFVVVRNRGLGALHQRQAALGLRGRQSEYDSQG